MRQNKIVYPYIPNSVPEIQSKMLKEINVENIMDLYEEIPEHLKFKGKMNLPSLFWMNMASDVTWKGC